MASANPGQSNTAIEATRKQVDEVQNIMRTNVEKVMERDGKLSHLEERADQLQVDTSFEFESSKKCLTYFICAK